MNTCFDPPLTVADLEGTPDDGNRYEIINGELYVSACPTIQHQSVLVNLACIVRGYLLENPVGKVLPSVGVVFDEFTCVVPDVVVVTNERLKQILKGDWFTGSPEIVVEILSPGSSNERRDRHVKRALYSSRGVHEYWIVDPASRSIEIHRKRKTGGLKFVVQLQGADELTTILLPGFSLSVEAIFAEQG